MNSSNAVAWPTVASPAVAFAVVNSSINYSSSSSSAATSFPSFTSPPFSGFCESFICPWGSACTRGFGWPDLASALPSLIFVIFLARRHRRAVRKLQQSRAQMMAAYYWLLWATSLLNIVRCLLEPWGGGASHMWMWLLSNGSMLLLEVSVLTFLWHAHLVHAGEALLRTFCISSAIAAADALLQALLSMHERLSLFALEQSSSSSHMSWQRWTFWTWHEMLLAMLYGATLVLPFTRWKDRLPAKPSFYHYSFVLFALHICSALATWLLSTGIDCGFCMKGLAQFLYLGGLPLLLYRTFLMDFFDEDDLPLIDDAYYSEMRDAGYFDADWD